MNSATNIFGKFKKLNKLNFFFSWADLFENAFELNQHFSIQQHTTDITSENDFWG
jgi:hypothetical protein